MPGVVFATHVLSAIIWTLDSGYVSGGAPHRGPQQPAQLGDREKTLPAASEAIGHVTPDGVDAGIPRLPPYTSSVSTSYGDGVYLRKNLGFAVPWAQRWCRMTIFFERVSR
jgi:hypothetical protein